MDGWSILRYGAVGTESRILKLYIRVDQARCHRKENPRAEICRKNIVDFKQEKWVETERAHLAHKSKCKGHRFKSMQRFFHEMQDVVQEVGGQKWD